MAQEIYSFFEDKLQNQEVALGNEIGVWDKERKPIDAVVIHHTEILPGLTKERLSAIGLVRLYAPQYAKPSHREDTHVIGKRISSGHVREDRQVFWPYHWIVRMDGGVEQLLRESEIGWQAGNWDINCRSVAIALDNNYMNSRPDDIVLKTTAELIRSKYKYIPKDRIYGHREVRLGDPMHCPSNLFLSRKGKKGWKEDLLDLIF